MPAEASVCSACGRDRAEDVTLDTPAGSPSVAGTILPTPVSRAEAAPSPAASRRSSAASRRSPDAGDSLSAAILPEGTEIGHRYRVVALLGRGGMGAVYRVRDEELNRDVALKLIRPEIAADADVIGRFKREIQLSSRVTHKNVLRVYDLGEADGISFLTMQFVDGRDLSTILKKQGKLPTERLLHIFRQAAEGLRLVSGRLGGDRIVRHGPHCG